MQTKLVEFRHVSFRYSDEQPWVLHDVSFEVYENESVAIIGHNGSGKSTIAKLMNGLLFPQKGEILIGGKQVNKKTVWDIRREVGMVFQNPDNQFVGTTVQDDVAFGMENRGIPRKQMLEKMITSLKAVGMEDHRETEPHRLSGGQKQRVAIAGVLAVSPRVLILDEATSMLDPRGRREIMQTVVHVQAERNMSLITITHDLHEVIQAEKVIVMNKGTVWQISTPREVFSQRTAMREIGLDVPFVTILTDELRQSGVPIANEPLNHKELLESLWILHSRT